MSELLTEKLRRLRYIARVTAPDFSARIRRIFGELSLEGSAPPAPGAAESPPALSDPESFVEPLNRYLQLLDAWNARLDLSAARDHDELTDLYVADSWLLSHLVPAGAERWVDVGTGAGAPGLGLKILRPELDLTLVEPLSKRISFLRTVLGTLVLPSIVAKKLRTESLKRGSFSTAVSRATLKPGNWLTEGARIATDRVWVLLAQGSPPTLEGWHVHQDATYRWPLTGVQRRALCYVPVAPGAEGATGQNP